MSDKKRAFIGLAGPFGYAYAHERPKLGGDYSSPNAVLENVAGLLLCYDDLYFLSKQFCPVDMWDLPYVHFIMEDVAKAKSASIAIEQAHTFCSDESLDHQLNFTKFGEISAAMQSGSSVDFAIDNHTHGIQLGPDLMVSGDANRAENVVSDVFVAQALSLTTGDLDLVVSSPALSPLVRSKAEGSGIRADFDHPKRSLTSAITTIRTENFLTPRGSYHESYEELRHHPHIKEFRAYISSFDVEVHEVSSMASEVSRIAGNYAGKVLAKHIKGVGRFQSLGLPALKSAGNHLHPFAGTAFAGALSFLINRQDNTEKKAMAWAPFVYDLGNRVS